MKILTLEDWPWAARNLAVQAQLDANACSHAMTTGAHVARVLLAMQPVRRIVASDAAECAAIDTAIERATLLVPKSSAKVATFSTLLEKLLSGDGARSTVNFLRTAMLGLPALSAVEAKLAAHAEAIASLLDAPDLAMVLTNPMSESAQRRVPPLALGQILASERGHRDLTTRHLVAAMLKTYDRVLVKAGQA
ncbi:MAG TPA: hypothetical protein VM925_17830, partial [Labilithrix sp.]|nr:hypothetical protein [Labilithrix sp.]